MQYLLMTDTVESSKAANPPEMSAPITLELSELQARKVETHESDVNALTWEKKAFENNKSRQNQPQQNRDKPRSRPRCQTHQKAEKQNNSTCRNCGGASHTQKPVLRKAKFVTLTEKKTTGAKSVARDPANQ